MIIVKCPLCEVKVQVETNADKGDLVNKLKGNKVMKQLKADHEAGKHDGE